MNQYKSSWIIFLSLCTLVLSGAIKENEKFVEIYEIDSNNLVTMPPFDPAIHSFPTVPTAPLLPMCTMPGYFRDPFNCGKFYYCVGKDAVPMTFYCQHGYIFDTITDSCDHPELVEC